MSPANSKHEAPNPKQTRSPKEGNSKRYDLEDRTLAFAQAVRAFIKQVKRTICNIEDGRQLVRASGSAGANYIEANEALSKKDFRMRIKISRKEATELASILSSILRKSE
jgi:four helix bundle protein